MWGGWPINATSRPIYHRKSPGTRYKVDWVVPRDGLFGCLLSNTERDFNHGLQAVAIRYSE